MYVHYLTKVSDLPPLLLCFYVIQLGKLSEYETASVEIGPTDSS
jgi:hypothetical protein